MMSLISEGSRRSLLARWSAGGMFERVETTIMSLGFDMIWVVVSFIREMFSQLAKHARGNKQTVRAR